MTLGQDGQRHHQQRERRWIDVVAVARERRRGPDTGCSRPERRRLPEGRPRGRTACTTRSARTRRRSTKRLTTWVTASRPSASMPTSTAARAPRRIRGDPTEAIFPEAPTPTAARRAAKRGRPASARDADRSLRRRGPAPAPSAIEQARARGLRVVGVDRNSRRAARRRRRRGHRLHRRRRGRRGWRPHPVDGVLTVSADRAVPVVAAVAERLGLLRHRHGDRAPAHAQDRHAPDARGGRRRSRASPPSAATRRRGRAGDGGPPGSAEAGRLGRAARHLPPGDGGRSRRAPARGTSPSPRPTRRSSSRSPTGRR